MVGIAVCVNTTIHNYIGLAVWLTQKRVRTERLCMCVCVCTLPYSWLHGVFRTGGSSTRGKGYLWSVQNSILRN